MSFGHRKPALSTPSTSKAPVQRPAPQWSNGDVRLFKETIAALVSLVAIAAGFALHKATTNDIYCTVRCMNRFDLLAVVLGVICIWFVVRACLGLPALRRDQRNRRRSDDPKSWFYDGSNGDGCGGDGGAGDCGGGGD